MPRFLFVLALGREGKTHGCLEAPGTLPQIPGSWRWMGASLNQFRLASVFWAHKVVAAQENLHVQSSRNDSTLPACIPAMADFTPNEV
eukprot:6128245-Amphidinium_carterae.1